MTHIHARSLQTKRLKNHKLKTDNAISDITKEIKTVFQKKMHKKQTTGI
jgi:hypothetical protein